jgi:hypothetical protein
MIGTFIAFGSLGKDNLKKETDERSNANQIGKSRYRQYCQAQWLGAAD